MLRQKALGIKMAPFARKFNLKQGVFSCQDAIEMTQCIGIKTDIFVVSISNV